MNYKNKKEYQKYLNSPEWKEKRKEIFEKRKGICELCGEKLENKYHVHHDNYNNLGNEKESDLILLCENCHNDIHKREKRNKGYVILDNKVLTSEKWLNMSTSSQIMYIYMKLWAGNRKTFYYSYSLANKILSSRTTFSKAIKELETNGFINVERQTNGKPNIYTIIK